MGTFRNTPQNIVPCIIFHSFRSHLMIIRDDDDDEARKTPFNWHWAGNNGSFYVPIASKRTTNNFHTMKYFQNNARLKWKKCHNCNINFSVAGECRLSFWTGWQFSTISSLSAFFFSLYTQNSRLHVFRSLFVAYFAPLLCCFGLLCCPFNCSMAHNFLQFT